MIEAILQRAADAALRDLRRVRSGMRAPAPLPGILLCACTAWHAPAAAQEPAAATAGEGCDGPVIGEIFIDNHTIYPPVSDSDTSVGWIKRFAYWVANRVHHRTRRSLIRDELLFRDGDCYDAFLVEESGRILRGLPFIADADVYPVGVSEAETHVVVDTRDDWTLKLDIRPEFDQRLRITHVSFTEENLLGTGTLLGAYLVEENERRDLGLELRTPRLSGTRTDARLGAGRTRTGSFIHESLTYPFVGEVGRWAFVEFLSRREDLFRYIAPAGANFDRVNLPLKTSVAAAMVARRFGTPGDLTIVGGGLLWEDVSFDAYPGGVTVMKGIDYSAADTADAATAALLGPHANGRRAVRVNLLVGKRNIRFVNRRGFDGLTGDQDIRVGAQVVGTLGTTLGTPAWASGDDHHELRGWVTLFGGAAGDGWVVNSELTVEAARPFAGGAGGVRDVLAEGAAYFYWRPGSRATDAAGEAMPRHTLVLGVKGVGGWDNTLPFQLTLGGANGVRGYTRDDFPGGRRLVVHLEDRVLLKTFPGLADLGVTVFADAGASWGGDVPFGADSGLRGTVGAGLRLGFPPGVRRVLRVDLAAPLDDAGLGRPRLLVGYDAVSLLAGFADRQARRSRGASAAREILGNR